MAPDQQYDPVQLKKDITEIKRGLDEVRKDTRKSEYWFSLDLRDFIALPLVIAGVVGTLALGPMDFGRSVYNQVVGDTTMLKRQLTDYVRRGIAAQHPGSTPDNIESILGRELHTKRKDGKVDPQDASIVHLWDAAEDCAPSTYQRWVWPSLDE